MAGQMSSAMIASFVGISTPVHFQEPQPPVNLSFGRRRKAMVLALISSMPSPTHLLVNHPAGRKFTLWSEGR